MMKKALLISCFEEWYKNRLKPICGLLNNCGYEIKCLLSDYNHISKKYTDKKTKECEYIHVPEYKNNISLQRISSHLFFGKKVNEVIDEYKPDIVYLVLPPNNTAKYCAKYKKSHPNAIFIVDIIDLWPESMPLGTIKNTPPAKMWRDWRDNAIRIADHVFIECELYQEKLGYIIDSTKTSALHLFKEQTEEERRLVRQIMCREMQNNVIRFAYLGSMNNIIDIEGICGIIKQFVNSGKSCELHAVGNGEKRETFEREVQDTGCKTYFYGPVFDEIEKIKILAPCDYAFNMMKGDISVGLTIKSIDYLSYGLPLINNIKGDTWRLVEEKGIGMNVIDNEEMSILNKTIEHNCVYDVYLNYFNLKAFICNINQAMVELGLNDD